MTSYFSLHVVTTYVQLIRSLVLLLLVNGAGVGASLDRLGGELLPHLVNLAKETVLGRRVVLSVPLLLVAANASADFLGKFRVRHALGDEVGARVDGKGD